MCITLESPIDKLKGIGTKKKLAMKKLNIEIIEDLINFYPKRYEDFTSVINISEININNKNLIKGVIKDKKKNYVKGKTSQLLRLIVEDKTGGLEIIFFNGYFLNNLLNIEKEYLFYGEVDSRGTQKVMIHPEIIKIKEYKKGFYPIYSLTEGITNKEIRNWQNQILNLAIEYPDVIPYNVRQKYHLISIDEAFKNIHFPKSKELLVQSKYRLIFQEMFILQWRIEQFKKSLKNNVGGYIFDDFIDMEEFYSFFDFKPTNSQRKVIEEIFSDMSSGKVMNRLIQGDVGSGKTFVAQASMFIALKGNTQSTIIAPTEILAFQHFENTKKVFDKVGGTVAFLSGSTKKTDREKLLVDLASGKIDILIGTHAVLQKDVQFKNLSLAIIDEQHKFGVNQRQLLGEKGRKPHLLIMTATPVPRSLAIVLYGDLDISIIDELPKGRIPIETYSAKSKSLREKKIYDFISKQVIKGNQVYIVVPTIHTSEKLEGVKSVDEVYNNIKKILPTDNIEMLHGEMKEEEKEKKLIQFKQGNIKVLVSTVVIEVGVDVPNATIILIENAERFGLAQLHQLRGRVGRGSEKSYCFLVYNNPTEIGLSRIETMCKTNDGFIIAEEDLKLRGPGEFFGTKQHGDGYLKIADLIEHRDILMLTKQIVKDISKDKVLIKIEEKELLDYQVKKMNQDKLNI